MVHVLDENFVHSLVDALLLDSGNPNLDIKELGGTGRTHNWKNRFVDRVERRKLSISCL